MAPEESATTGSLRYTNDQRPGIRRRRAGKSFSYLRTRLLAAIVRLLETTLIRVGNEEYARTNNSFGLTTMQDRHVAIDGADIHFRFRGKSGKSHEVWLNDRRLARLVKRCRDLPGSDLFQYLDDAGEPQPISSGDVNTYLREASGEDYTAKDIRTWAGTLLAASQLDQHPVEGDTALGKSAALRAIEAVARQLGNTVSICRKCYIHPTVLAAYQNPELHALWSRESAAESADPELSHEESALLRFLASAAGHSG